MKFTKDKTSLKWWGDFILFHFISFYLSQFRCDVWIYEAHLYIRRYFLFSLILILSISLPTLSSPYCFDSVIIISLVLSNNNKQPNNITTIETKRNLSQSRSLTELVSSNFFCYRDKLISCDTIWYAYRIAPYLLLCYSYIDYRYIYIN